MTRLLSGSTLRRGGSGEFLDLKGAQPQLPPTDTTATGFTLITDEFFRTSYRSSLGFIEFTTASMYSSLPDGTIRILSTGSSLLSTNTSTGNLVVQGGIGVGGNMHIEDDIVVNGLTIGRGYEGINNIVIRGDAEPQINEFNEGQECIAIGYSTLGGLTTGYKNIAIGRFALSSGTDLTSSIAIGDSALKQIGILSTIAVGTITNITTSTPVIVTVPGHSLTSGTMVTINDVVGMIQLNDGAYYIKVTSSSTVALYNDSILLGPVTGTNFDSYISGGVVSKVLKKNNNIAIGVDAARGLIDGEQNFFFGDGVAKNLTTGSYNYFIGHEVGNNMITGNANIAIGADNLIDGVDDQVNIGSVFYYNGGGYLQLNADTGLGLGTESTGTNNGAFTVLGGMGVTGSAFIGGAAAAKNFSSRVAEITTATGVVEHDYSVAAMFNHTNISDSFTANITNFNLDAGSSTDVTMILVQAGTAYMVNALQINGVSQTIKWKNGIPPTGDFDTIDVVVFTIMNFAGTYTVFGQVTSFS